MGAATIFENRPRCQPVTSLRVLHIEPNLGKQRLLHAFLADGRALPGHWSVDHVGNLVSAINALGAHAYDLIVVNPMLSDVSGRTAVEHVRIAAPETPILALIPMEMTLARDVTLGGADEVIVAEGLTLNRIAMAVTVAFTRKHGAAVGEFLETPIKVTVRQ